MAPISHHDAANGPGEFKFKSIQKKEINDKTTGQKINLQFLELLFSQDGSITKPVFETPQVTFPRGVEKEEYKIKALCVFDTSDSEVNQMVETPSHTQKKGYVKKSCVNLEIDIDKKTATSKDGPLDVYETPDGEVKFQASPEDELIVIGQKGTKWLHVKTPGITGDIQKIHDKAAEVIFEKKDELGLDHIDDIEQIRRMIKHPIYWPRNRETNEFDPSKNPSCFSQFLYYRDRETGLENFANLNLVGTGDKLMPDDLIDVSITGVPVLNYSRWLIGKDRINPQTKIVNMAVTKLEKRERPNIQSETLTRLAVDKEQERKNRQFLEERRKNISPKKGGLGNPPEPETGSDDLDELMGSVTASMEDVEITPDNDHPDEIPGL